MEQDNNKLAQAIEHTYLQPAGNSQAIAQLCQQAIAYNLGAVCILPYWLPYARQALLGTACRLTCVVGFPFGATASACKALETSLAIQAGADEVDMVVHLPALAQADWSLLQTDVAAVVAAAQGKPVKVIMEIGLFPQERWLAGALRAYEAGATYIKTCTGFAPGKATVAALQLLRHHLPAACKLKASGGIAERAQALALLDAGAERLGTSKGHLLMITGATAQTDGPSPSELY